MQVRYYYWLCLLLILFGCEKETPSEKIDLYPVKIGKQYGYINAQGKVAIKPAFFSVNWFSGSRAIVETAPGRKAMIDKKGNIIFQDTTGFLHTEYREGLVKFETKDQKSCFVDSLGIIKFCLSDSVVFAESVFSCERLLVRLPGGFFAYLDTNGNEVYRFKRGFPGNYSDQLVRRSFAGRTCYFNKKGVQSFCVKGQGGNFNNGVTIVDQKGFRYLVNKKGDIITENLVYDNIAKFQEGYAIISKGNKMGVLNTTGTEVIAPQYHHVTPFTGGVALVKFDKDWSIINTKNEIITNKKIEQIAAPGFLGELAYVYADSTWGYMNKKGEMVWKTDVKLPAD